MSLKTFDVNRKNLQNILHNHYQIDYYQREYKWGYSQINDLLHDLYTAFNEDYITLKENNELPSDRHESHQFRNYFLGSIVVSKEGSDLKIVDGQQRMVSLSLIFLYLYNNLQSYSPRESQIEILFRSAKYSDTKQYNIGSPQVQSGFEAIIHKKELPQNSAALVLRDRYRDITEYFSNRLEEYDKKLFFLHWLRENVLMVEIMTFSKSEAFTVFETMNDRGLPLQNHEMLKGFLLTSVSDEKQEEYTEKWERIIKRIQGVAGRSDIENIDKFFISVLQGHFAQWNVLSDVTNDNSRQQNYIIDLYHRWVKDNAGELLKSEEHYEIFIDKLDYFSKHYISFYDKTAFQSQEDFIKMSLLDKDQDRIKKIDAILPVLFAAIDPDDETDNERRIQIVGRLYDTFISRKMWSDPGSPVPSFKIIPNLIAIFQEKDIDKSCLLSYLYLNRVPNPFDYNAPIEYKNSQSAKNISYLLLRITEYFEDITNKERWFDPEVEYKIEHILSQSNDKDKKGFNSDEEFSVFSNQIGALLLMPKDVLKDHRSKQFKNKLHYYQATSTLASLLSNTNYNSDGDLIGFAKIAALEEEINEKFSPLSRIESFSVENVIERNRIYSKVLQQIFDPSWFIEQSEYTLQELEELYEDDEDYLSEFFKGISTLSSNKTQETLQNIYFQYSEDQETPIRVQFMTSDGLNSLKDLFLNSGGKFTDGSKIFDTPAQVVSNVGQSKVNGWYRLYLVYNQDGREVKTQLHEARERINSQ